jgi:hypothetical protein
VTGTGFTPGGKATVAIRGRTQPSVSIELVVSSTGGISDSTFSNPNVLQFVADTYTWSATDQATGRTSNSVMIVVSGSTTTTTTTTTTVQPTVLETILVAANGSPVHSQTVLKNNTSYQLRASGTVTVDCCGAVGDAEWVLFPSGAINPTCGTTPDVHFGIGVNDTSRGATKSPNWGPYNSSHTYVITFNGTGSTITFDYHDCVYSDNTGSLKVEIIGVP